MDPTNSRILLHTFGSVFGTFIVAITSVSLYSHYERNVNIDLPFTWTTFFTSFAISSVSIWDVFRCNKEK